MKRNNLLPTLIGAIAFVSIATFGAVGFTGLSTQRARSNHAEWMTALPDSTKIEDMSIPGTHDSLALYGIGDFIGQCQDLPVSEQLELGARFLDIRLQVDANQMKGVHGIVDQKTNFATTIAELHAFLDAHPKETIFISVKEEEDPVNSTMGFDECFRKYMEEDRWYTASTMPETLGEIRGKMVLLSRFSTDIGILCNNGWADNASFQLGELFIQDEYCLKDVETKKQAVMNCFANTNKYKINYFSGYLDGAFPPSYSVEVAKAMNAFAKETLPSIGNKGICLFDFISTDLMNLFF